MPIEYKTYGCSFKCGYRHTKDKKRVEKHEEEQCFMNPELQTCETCDFNNSHHDICPHDELPGCPTERWFVRSCTHDHGTDLIDQQYEQLKMESGWVKPIMHCPFHSSISDEERQLQDNFWDSND